MGMGTGTGMETGTGMGMPMGMGMGMGTGTGMGMGTGTGMGTGMETGTGMGMGTGTGMGTGMETGTGMGMGMGMGMGTGMEMGTGMGMGMGMGTGTEPRSGAGAAGQLFSLLAPPGLLRLIPDLQQQLRAELPRSRAGRDRQLQPDASGTLRDRYVGLSGGRSRAEGFGGGFAWAGSSPKGNGRARPFLSRRRYLAVPTGLLRSSRCRLR